MVSTNIMRGHLVFKNYGLFSEFRTKCLGNNFRRAALQRTRRKAFDRHGAFFSHGMFV